MTEGRVVLGVSVGVYRGSLRSLVSVGDPEYNHGSYGMFGLPPLAIPQTYCSGCRVEVERSRVYVGFSAKILRFETRAGLRAPMRECSLCPSSSSSSCFCRA